MLKLKMDSQREDHEKPSVIRSPRSKVPLNFTEKYSADTHPRENFYERLSRACFVIYEEERNKHLSPRGTDEEKEEHVNQLNLLYKHIHILIKSDRLECETQLEQVIEELKKCSNDQKLEAIFPTLDAMINKIRNVCIDSPYVDGKIKKILGITPITVIPTIPAPSPPPFNKNFLKRDKKLPPYNSVYASQAPEINEAIQQLEQDINGLLNARIMINDGI